MKKTGEDPYSEEEIELAQAAGERLLDMLAGSEMARLSLELLRQRVAQARVLDGQGRRVLHDEVLPELHTSLLYLSALAAAHPAVRQAVETLSAAHRRISDLLRDDLAGRPSPPGPGRPPAPRCARCWKRDLAGEFTGLTWEIDPAAEERALTVATLRRRSGLSSPRASCCATPRATRAARSPPAPCASPSACAWRGMVCA